MLSNVDFYFYRTFDAGNIGSALRAMRNMDLGKLYAVDPMHYDEEKIEKMAAGAKKYKDDYLKVISFEESQSILKENHLIIATTARKRREVNYLDFQSIIKLTADLLKDGNKVSFLFGNETNGLKNEEIECANFISIIPTSEEYSSLNLSQAALIYAFALFQKINSSEKQDKIFHSQNIANLQKREELYQNFISLLDIIGFTKENTRKRSLFYWRETFDKLFLLSMRETDSMNEIFLFLIKHFSGENFD